MNLQELIEWHEHQSAECRHEGEEEQKSFHELAAELLKQISSEEAWHAQILEKQLEGWTTEERENLFDSLDVAVQTTCDQVSAEVDKDFTW